MTSVSLAAKLQGRTETWLEHTLRRKNPEKQQQVCAEGAIVNFMQFYWWGPTHSLISCSGFSAHIILWKGAAFGCNCCSGNAYIRTQPLTRHCKSSCCTTAHLRSSKHGKLCVLLHDNGDKLGCIKANSTANKHRIHKSKILISNVPWRILERKLNFRKFLPFTDGDEVMNINMTR